MYPFEIKAQVQGHWEFIIIYVVVVESEKQYNRVYIL